MNVTKMQTANSMVSMEARPSFCSVAEAILLIRDVVVEQQHCVIDLQVVLLQPYLLLFWRNFQAATKSLVTQSRFSYFVPPSSGRMVKLSKLIESFQLTPACAAYPTKLKAAAKERKLTKKKRERKKKTKKRKETPAQRRRRETKTKTTWNVFDLNKSIMVDVCSVLINFQSFGQTVD